MSKLTKIFNASNDDINTEKRVTFFSSINNWIKVRGIARTLYQLDDRTLEDMGIPRNEIPAYAIKAVKQDDQSAA
jgi:uncharacterized protein YjiS (DUF1127 family)